jgi:hypothetical protein
MGRLVWAFQPLDETDGQTGYVELADDVAEKLIAAGKVQDGWTPGDSGLKHVDGKAVERYATRQIKAGGPKPTPDPEQPDEPDLTPEPRQPDELPPAADPPDHPARPDPVKAAGAKAKAVDKPTPAAAPKSDKPKADKPKAK